MPNTRAGRLFLHAPNVHLGGGLTLLCGLLRAPNASFARAQLDRRIAGRCRDLAEMRIAWVNRSLLSRLQAEWRLYRECTGDDMVLCFHGLPPLLRLRGRTIVFAQNRLLFESGSLAQYPLSTRLRLWVERHWTRQLAGHCNGYVVQTESMAATVRSCLGVRTRISVLPFSSFQTHGPSGKGVTAQRKHDFIYVASGDPHKNHANLLAAWGILAETDIRPSLALTVDPLRYPGLARRIEDLRTAHGLPISNYGWVDPEDMADLYRSASALIFPSRVESLGLPLVEAQRMGLAIVAAERDYVRDVVLPQETFDPDSPLSIARAVRRFLGISDEFAVIRSPQGFLAELLT